MKKSIVLFSLIAILSSCGTKTSVSTSHSSESTGTDSLTTSGNVSDTVGMIYELQFNDAKNGERYETEHGEWVLDVSSSSYDGAIKLQYGRNSSQGKSNYLMSPYHNYVGEITIDINCYATINDTVITSDPFEFAVIGLDSDLNVVEEDAVTSVLEMPNPTANDSVVKTFHLKNDENRIKRIKIELKTKLTSSNVGIKSVIVTGR